MRDGYLVKECFLTVQGEGARAGTKAAFCRFAGCDLWTGREEDRSKGRGSCSDFCDTAFFGGDRYALSALLLELNTLWPRTSEQERWVVITGGEPSLQVDHVLVEGLHNERWNIAIETNGCHDNEAVRRCDHICISPKRARAGGVTDWKALGEAHEIKVVLPGAAPGEPGWTDEELLEIEDFVGPSVALFVQPQDPVSIVQAGSFLDPRNTREKLTKQAIDHCVDFVLGHPRWRISSQQHKLWQVR